jgi:hypothetical protein
LIGKDKSEILMLLKILQGYVDGAYSVCDHENSSATFEYISNDIEEIISILRKLE